MPNDAKSEFLANRAMGDWAERIFAASIRKSQPGWQVTHYGDSDNKAAGDDGFKEFYLGLLEEVRKYGKRPDLLIFAKALNIPEDISQLTRKETDPLASYGCNRSFGGSIQQVRIFEIQSRPRTGLGCGESRRA